MDDKIIVTFCLCDDLLKAIQHQEDRQCHMNDAEIMTTALVASLFFRGNHESARTMLKQHGYIPHMLSKSRFSRRLHRIKDVFIIFFNLLGKIWKTLRGYPETHQQCHASLKQHSCGNGRQDVHMG